MKNTHKKKKNPKLKKCFSIKNKNGNFLTLFNKQVKKNPNKIIAITDNYSLTYNELNQKSNQIAIILKQNKIKTENLIGLYSSLNINFIICLLGIIKAGATYFPIDPTLSEQQIQDMLTDSHPALILVEAKFSSLLKNQKILRIDEKILNHTNEKIVLKRTFIKSKNLAYVIYTSGTTGKPKGIMITHKSLPNIALAHKNYYPSNLRMLVSGSVCFDANLLVIFHALINNEALYLFDYNAKNENSLNALIRFIKKHLINYMICVPSQYLRLLQKGKKIDSLKCVSLTGENLPMSLCNLHAKTVPNAILYNEYGPTEYAIGSTIAKIYDPRSKVISNITAGKPLKNTHIYILDQNFNIQKNGKSGEICISGIGLARGYLKNEKLTKEKFIWIKNSKGTMERIYRTGDIGKILTNGNLEFLGRIDNIIQDHKNQINLNKIEYFLSRYPNIFKSAILIKNNNKGKPKLIAYINYLKNISQKRLLQKYLQKFLPKNMIPLIIEINKFPFSRNGKIDKEALFHYHE